MLGKLFGIFSILSLGFAFFTGNIEALGSAVLDGAASAVQVSLSLCGMMCFWGGMMQVMTEAGAMRKLSRMLRPLLKILFPQAAKTGEGLEEISANISANLLGVGNAATPFALRAMEQLQKHNPHPSKASGEQITLAVLNTASVSLIPSTLLALRRASGSARPYEILFPVWIVSFCSSFFALFLCCLLARCDGKGKET